MFLSRRAPFLVNSHGIASPAPAVPERKAKTAPRGRAEAWGRGDLREASASAARLTALSLAQAAPGCGTTSRAGSPPTWARSCWSAAPSSSKSSIQTKVGFPPGPAQATLGAAPDFPGTSSKDTGALQAGGPCSGAHKPERHETTELVHTGPWSLSSDVAPKSTWGYVIVGETGLGSQMWPRSLPQLGTLGKAFAPLCPVPTWRGGWRTERSAWASFSAELGAW